MRIVDAHHHLWNPATNIPNVGYVWTRNIGAMKPFGDPTAIQRDYMLEEFLNEPRQHQIVGSVHVQSDGAIPDPVRETDFIHNIADTAAHPVAIIGFVDLSSKQAARTIERHRISDDFRGVRQILSRIDQKPEISFADRHFIRDDRWCDQFGLLAENALSFDLQCYPEQMPEIAEFLALHPNVPVAIDHAGSPYDQSPDGLTQWHTGMSLLADLPEVSVKLSGFGMFDANWNDKTIRPLFESMYELFGGSRLMFGSNYPVDKLMRTYNDIVSDIKNLCDEVDPQLAKQVFETNTGDFYGLEV